MYSLYSIFLETVWTFLVSYLETSATYIKMFQKLLFESFLFLVLTQTAYRNSWTLDARVGRWTLDAGLWTLDAGLWTLDPGRYT